VVRSRKVQRVELHRFVFAARPKSVERVDGHPVARAPSRQSTRSHTQKTTRTTVFFLLARRATRPLHRDRARPSFPSTESVRHTKRHASRRHPSRRRRRRSARVPIHRNAKRRLRHRRHDRSMRVADRGTMCVVVGAFARARRQVPVDPVDRIGMHRARRRMGENAPGGPRGAKGRRFVSRQRRRQRQTGILPSIVRVRALGPDRIGPDRIGPDRTGSPKKVPPIPRSRSRRVE